MTIITHNNDEALQICEEEREALKTDRRDDDLVEEVIHNNLKTSKKTISYKKAINRFGNYNIL